MSDSSDPSKPASVPGTFVRTSSDGSGQKTRIVLCAYNPEQFDTLELTSFREASAIQTPGVLNWIHVESMAEIHLMSEFQRHLELHPLVRDALGDRTQRPKVEMYEDHVFVAMRVVRTGERGEVVSQQLCMVLGDGFLLSVVEEPLDVFDAVRTRLSKEGSVSRRRGSDYLLYRLMDTVVEHYFVQIEALGDRLEWVDDRLTAGETENALQDIYRTKHELTSMRKAVWPLREVMQSFDHIETDLIAHDTNPFFRDVRAQVVQVFDTLSIQRDMVASLIDLNLNIQSQRMNEIMKVLTIISTIFIPLSFLAGLYGMNFAYMPELSWGPSYFVLLGVMACVAVAMLLFFRRRGWL